MPAAQPPRLLDRVRHAARLRHLSRRTEEAYLGWIRRFIVFHGKRHPDEMGAGEVVTFLSHLAVDRLVATSTQNQALAAILFLYRDVLGQELPWLDDLVRAKTPARLPVVLTRGEVRAVLALTKGTPRLMAFLLYGSGLRLLARFGGASGACTAAASTRPRAGGWMGRPSRRAGAQGAKA